MIISIATFFVKGEQYFLLIYSDMSKRVVDSEFRTLTEETKKKIFHFIVHGED